MKYLFRILILLTFVGCGTAPEQKQEEETKILTQLDFDGDETKPYVVMITGDEEYRSEEALPQLAKILSTHHGFRTTVLFAQDPERPGIVDPNYLHNIPGLHQLADADLMIIFTRFRALPDDQMAHIDNYLKSGKPVIGIRTSTHAFMFEESEIESSYKHYGNFYDGDDEWIDGFGRLILGEKWISHHGWHGHQSTKGLVAPGADAHPIMTSIADGDVWGPTDVYGVRLPLPGDSQPLVLGQVTTRAGERDESDVLYGMRSTDSEVPGIITEEDDDGKEFEMDQNDPIMPVAWVKSYQVPGGKNGKAFASTVGASSDMLEPGTRRMYVNAVHWLLDIEVPVDAKVDIVGEYNPTQFAFKEDKYWDDLNISIADLQ